MKNGIRCAIAIMLCVGILLPSTAFAYNVFLTPSGTTYKYVGENVHYHTECLYCYGGHDLDWVNNWDCLTDVTYIDEETWIDAYGTANTPGTYVILGSCGYHGYDSASLVIRSLTSESSETTKIIADDGLAGDEFGYSVSIDGDTAIVGAPLDDNTEGVNSGSAYVYVRNGNNWEEEAKLTASTEGAAGDKFGFSVFLDDNTAIIGAPYDDDGGSAAGSAYVFVRSGTSWSQETKLHASDPAADDIFGYSVSVSDDYAIVSAHADDDYGGASGSAYIFVRSGASWSEQTKLHASDASTAELFGYSVAIDNPYAVVSALRDERSAGSAYIFYRSGATWTEQAKLLASDGDDGDYFGSSVAISDPYVLIGAEEGDGNSYDSGAAYIFTRTNTNWTQTEKLTASDGVTDDRFGQSVSIVDDVAIVGANAYTDMTEVTCGSAYLFVRTGGDWDEASRLYASDAGEGDEFGFAVGIEDDFAIVGAYGDDDKGADAGAAYIFDIDDVTP